MCLCTLVCIHALYHLSTYIYLPSYFSIHLLLSLFWLRAIEFTQLWVPSNLELLSSLSFHFLAKIIIMVSVSLKPVCAESLSSVTSPQGQIQFKPQSSLTFFQLPLAKVFKLFSLLATLKASFTECSTRATFQNQKSYLTCLLTNF